MHQAKVLLALLEWSQHYEPQELIICFNIYRTSAFSDESYYRNIKINIEKLNLDQLKNKWTSVSSVALEMIFLKRQPNLDRFANSKQRGRYGYYITPGSVA